MEIEILRIGIKFGKAISRLSIEDKAYILDGLFSLSNNEDYYIKDDFVGDLLILIQKENENMCKRANNKQKISNEPKTEPKTEPKVDTKEKEKEKEKDLSKPQKIFEEGSFELKISKRFYELKQGNIITESLYKKNGDKLFQEWSKEINLLKNKDGFSEKQITEVLTFCIEDDFWNRNINTINKLRKKNKDGISYFIYLLNKIGKHSTVK